MNKEEILKAINELPKLKTDNPISAMNSINVDDFMSAIDRLDKTPTYQDLLKENKQLKEKYLNAVADYETEKYKNSKAIELLDKLNIQLKDVLKTEINIKEISDIKEILKGEDNE